MRVSVLAAISSDMAFFFEVAGKVSGVQREATVLELINRRAHGVEEIAVMRDHEDASVGVAEVFLEPGDRRDVEMVRRLVEKEEPGVVD